MLFEEVSSMKLFSLTSISLLAILVFSTATTAQELDGTLKKIKTTGVFSLGYREASPPFSFPGPDKKPVGYSIDLCTHIARAVQKQLGVNLKLDWVPVTAQNRIDMVAKGKIDIECGTTTATLSRQEQVDFSLMTFVDGGSLMTLAEANFRDIGELAGKRIGVVAGTTTEKALAYFLKDKFITADQIEVKNHVEGRKALEEKVIDAYASDRGVLIGLAVTAKEPKRFALADSFFSYEPYGFMLRRNDGAFRLVVNRALAHLYRSGEVAPIYERWFGAFGKPSEAIQSMYLLNGLPE